MAQGFWKKEIKLTRRMLLIMAAVFFVLAGIASGFFLNHVFPRLTGIPGLSLLTPNFTVVVNRTEEVRVVDNLETRDIYDQVRRNTVTVLSYNGVLSLPPQDNLKPNRQGAGVIMTSDGLIFTTKSIIGKADSTVFVMLDDGSMHQAKITAFDSRSELAVIKIEVQNLPLTDIEPASGLLAGDKVVVVGGPSTPFGAPMVVSAVKHRLYTAEGLSEVRSTEEVSHFLSLSETLGGDFIGGPVSNRQKRVVGLITSEGVLPGEYLKAALERYLDENSFVWAELGINYKFILPSQARLLGYQESYGLLIYADPGQAAVVSGGPAAKAGLRSGDLVIKLNGSDITESLVSELLSSLKPGEEVTVTYVRSGTRKTATLISAPLL